MLETVRQFWSLFFFAGNKIDKFEAIAHKVTKLADVSRRHKTTCDQIVLKDIGDPFCVFFIGFLTSDSFNVFRVSKDDAAVIFKDVVDRDPVFAGGFHTNVFAVVSKKPL